MLKVLIYWYLTNLYSSRKIKQALADKPVDKKVKQKLNYARKNWPVIPDKYDEQEKQFGLFFLKPKLRLEEDIK